MPSATKGPRNNRARASRPRADRDGDLLMGISSQTRARVGKGSNGPSKRGKDSNSKGGRKDDLISASTQRTILRKAAAAASDISMKDGRRPTGLTDIKVSGWDKSKASDSQDGGVNALIKWMEKKASLRLGTRKREVKIIKSRVDGTDLIISLSEHDAPGILRLNGFAWSGAKLHIQTTGKTPSQNSKTEETKAMLRSVLERRYNLDLKMLDFSSLVQDEELNAQAMFDKQSTASKCFPAMMVILEKSFDTKNELDAAVESVSLANNELQSLHAVTTLAQTLPRLKNLDLSNNKFENLDALANWRKRFHHLQHLIVSNNPLEKNEPNFAADLVNWYPNLRFLNNIQVRTEEEVANQTKLTRLPFPIRGPAFQDEGGIVETFIRTYFSGMDGDRQAMAAFYYDSNSLFTVALNSNSTSPPQNGEKTQKREWDQYITASRNLKKITNLPTRVNRVFTDPQTIAKTFAAMPLTKHPDLTTEAKKWMIEAHSQPGVPDPTGQSPTGVDGFNITVHCEFDEAIAAASSQPIKKRSADHTFIIGPNASGGIRIHQHEMCVRSHSGHEAFEPQDVEAWHTAAKTSSPPPVTVPQLPTGITIEVAEQMVIELAKQTGMNLPYSKDCLEQVGWDFPKAIQAFNTVKPNLPADAFIQVTV